MYIDKYTRLCLNRVFLFLGIISRIKASRGVKVKSKCFYFARTVGLSSNSHIESFNQKLNELWVALKHSNSRLFVVLFPVTCII